VQDVLALEGKPVEQLLAVMRVLRGPGGCPWDLEQSFETLKPYLVEETYEVLDAIDSGDPERLKGELGDVLLQVVFQAQIAKDEGLFTFEDVAETLSKKLIRRHPHVFGDAVAKTADDVLRSWEKIKTREKAGKTDPSEKGLLSGVPKHLPALLKCYRLCQKAGRVGFDWPDIAQVVDKVAEEAGELTRARTAAARKHEIGDLLFAVANLARHLGVDPESALQETNRRFISRFGYVEQELRKKGKSPSDSTLDEMDRLWDKAKRRERRRR